MLPNCVLDRGNSEVLAGFGTWYLILLCVVAVVIMLTAQERSRGIVVRASTSSPFRAPTPEALGAVRSAACWA